MQIYIRKLSKALQKFIFILSRIEKDKYLLFFFGFLFLTIIIRLFYLQIIKHDYYKKLLVSQHFSESSLKAQRGHIYVTDKSGKHIKLTENIDMFNVYVDPKFVVNKKRFLEILTPVVYKHLCEINGLEKPTKIQCLLNIENFTDTQVLKKSLDSSLSGQQLSGQDLQQTGFYDQNLQIDTEFLEQINKDVLENFSTGKVFELISNRLDNLVKGGIRESNYWGFFENDLLLNDLKQQSLPYVSINKNYIYFIPSKVTDIEQATSKLTSIFGKYGYQYTKDQIKASLVPKEIRYIKILSNVNSVVAKDIKKLKIDLYSEKYQGIPVLHGVGLEKTIKRYYPYSTFLSHVLGYVDDNGEAFYGVEKYFDDFLKGQDGKIVGLSVPWIGAIGSNSIDINDPIDGSDIYLTIDINLQNQLEKLLQFYHNDLKTDSISAIVIDPYTGKIKAMANYPNFDPNFFKEEYKIKPIAGNDHKIIDDSSFVDIPVLYLSGDKLYTATYEQRKDSNLKKFMFKNKLGPTVFVDKNISFPYEPGSIFKAFTLGIGIDTDELSMYDFYEDKGFIEVGPFTIKNVHKECLGTHTFLHALERSCNVGMVKMAIKFKKWAYYNYIERLGFGKKTGIELFGEEDGTIPAKTDFSLSRYYNNSFGQGLLVTPMQIAVAYSALLNGGYLVKPTIVEKLYDRKTNQFVDIKSKVQETIFKPATSEKMKEALFKVVSEGDLKTLYATGYTLGGKTGTSQIAFKGTYMGGAGWTNGSFVGIITKNNLKYVVVVQARRPRTCQRGLCSALLVFKDLAKYIIETEGIN